MATLIELLSERQKETDRDLKDLERLQSRYPGYEFLSPEDITARTKPGRAPRSPRVALSDLDDAVLKAVESDPSVEWISRAVHSYLKAGTYALAPREETAMNQIGASLSGLAEAGKITRTFEGRARNPHRYKALEKEKEVGSEEATS